jgi:hypothetical protein
MNRIPASTLVRSVCLALATDLALAAGLVATGCGEDPPTPSPTNAAAGSGGTSAGNAGVAGAAGNAGVAGAAGNAAAAGGAGEAGAAGGAGIGGGAGEAGAAGVAGAAGNAGVAGGAGEAGAAGGAGIGGAAGEAGAAGVAGGGGAAGVAGGAGASADASICGPADEHRVFFTDFEQGEAFGADVHSQFAPTAESATAYAVMTGQPFAGRSGKVLRGNFWQWKDGTSPKEPAFDPVAAAQGVSVAGTKQPHLRVRLREAGIVQSPSTDPQAENTIPGRAYVRVWLWLDDDFTYSARQEDQTLKEQSIKLFYTAGPNDTTWVTTAQNGYFNHFLNINSLGGWFTGKSRPGPKLEGGWHRLEFYFQTESKPLYYEYGGLAAHPELLASKCSNAVDYTIAFPVVGSSPQTCLTNQAALAQSSKDGVYRMWIDGQPIFDYTNIPLTGRLGGFSLPAYHGGGGQAVGSAGWALDDYCVRDELPPGL